MAQAGPLIHEYDLVQVAQLDFSLVIHINSRLKGEIHSQFESRSSTQTNLPKHGCSETMVTREQGKAL